VRVCVCVRERERERERECVCVYCMCVCTVCVCACVCEGESDCIVVHVDDLFITRCHKKSITDVIAILQDKYGDIKQPELKTCHTLSGNDVVPIENHVCGYKINRDTVSSRVPIVITSITEVYITDNKISTVSILMCMYS
jgi:hypothetical protein